MIIFKGIKDKIVFLVSTLFFIFFTSIIQAGEIEVSLTNATKGLYFTPILIIAHDNDKYIFRSGTPASPELKAMAEGGDISGLASKFSNLGADLSENPAQGLLQFGKKATATFNTDKRYLSLVSMLLPTNDGFVGVDSWMIPTKPGTYKIRLNGYDAGTEVNDEIAGNMPNPPVLNFGQNGTGISTVEINQMVHIHPGNLGDFDLQGGTSDLISSEHRWLNPVAVMTVVVK